MTERAILNIQSNIQAGRRVRQRADTQVFRAGIREFGLWNMEPTNVGVWFPEIARHSDDCRFNDCLHESEPGCAVKSSLERGEIEPWRFESYHRILESLREAQQ